MNTVPLSIGSAGLALLLYGNPGFALDRLFTTPAERAQLDALRFQAIGVSVDNPASIPEQITVNGIILGRGRNRVWVNGTNLAARHRSEGHQPEYNRVRYNHVPLKLSGRLVDIQLRPGESYMVTDGSKKDAFQQRPELDSETSDSPDDGTADKPVLETGPMAADAP